MEVGLDAFFGVKTVEETARSLGVQLQIVGARMPEEIEPAFRMMSQARVGAILVLADGTFFTHRARLADLAVVHRMPTMLAAKEYVDAGGLMSYRARYPEPYRRAAIYVDKILEGTKPSDLSVEQPTKYDLVINLKTATALGLTIPPSVLGRADDVIQ